MRIELEKVNIIKKIIYEYDKNAKIFLYGSMIDDNAKGGDIDLLILSNNISYCDKLYLRIKLKDQIGNQKIDMVVKKKIDTAFTRKAFEEGILL